MDIVGKVFAWFFLLLLGVLVLSILLGQGRSSAALASRRWMAWLLLYLAVPLSLIGAGISLWHHEWVYALETLGVALVLVVIAGALLRSAGHFN